MNTYSASALVALLTSLLLSLCEAYSSGGPTSKCTSLFPGHNKNPQSGISPFTISTGSSTYKAGETVTVIVTGSAYKGIMLQARVPGTTIPHGTFSNLLGGSYKVITCTGAADTITHSSSSQKTNLEATWTVPSDPPAEIQFVATVVINYGTIWTNQLSQVLKRTSSAIPQTNPPPVVTTETATDPEVTTVTTGVVTNMTASDETSGGSTQSPNTGGDDESGAMTLLSGSIITVLSFCISFLLGLL